MIEAFESKGLKANDYMEIDKYSGFVKYATKPGVEDELSWENQVKQAKANCLHLHTTVHEYAKIKMAESKEEKKNTPPDEEMLDWEVDMNENVGMLMHECEQLEFAAEYWKRNYFDLAQEHHELSKTHCECPIPKELELTDSLYVEERRMSWMTLTGSTNYSLSTTSNQSVKPMGYGI